MQPKNPRLCIFIHYFEQPYIPEYVRLWVNELSVRFDEVVLLSNKRKLVEELNFLPNVTICFQDNCGYDFGRFYSYIRTVNVKDYHTIAVVNDSNILINTLEHILRWEIIDKTDLFGLIDSHESPWFSTHKNSYHIQSHFLILNSKAIDMLDEYLQSVDIEYITNEKDEKKLRRKVIDTWEIGFTQFLKAKGLTTGTYIDSKDFNRRHTLPVNSNCTHKLYLELLMNGYPLIKKKLLANKQSRLSGTDNLALENLINEFGNKQWDLDKLMADLKRIKHDFNNNSAGSILKFYRKIFPDRNSVTT